MSSGVPDKWRERWLIPVTDQILDFRFWCVMVKRGVVSSAQLGVMWTHRPLCQ
jgi:hypothetical protein